MFGTGSDLKLDMMFKMVKIQIMKPYMKKCCLEQKTAGKKFITGGPACLTAGWYLQS